MYVPRHWLRRVPLLTAFGFAAGIFFYLRTRGLWPDLWLDEIYSVRQSDRALLDVPAASRNDAHPPLYYMCLSLWLEISRTDAWIRGLSLLFSGLHIVVMYRVVRAMAGRHAGAACALMCAASTGLFWIGYEARSWALFNLVCALAWLAVIRVRQRGRLRDHVWLSIWVAASLYTFYWGALVAVGLGVFFVSTKPSWRQVRNYAGSMVGAGLLFLPWLPIFLEHMKLVRGMSGNSAAIPPSEIGDVLEPWFVDIAPWVRVDRLPAALGVALAVGVVALLAWQLRKTHAQQRRAFVLPTLALALTFASLVFLGGRAGSFVHVKYMTFLATTLCALAALAARRLPLVLGIVLVVALTWSSMREARKVHRMRYLEPWRQAVNFIARNRQAGEDTWSWPPWISRAYDYYLPASDPRATAIPFDKLDDPEGPLQALRDDGPERIYFTFRYADSVEGRHPHERMLGVIQRWGWQEQSLNRWGNVSVVVYERPE